MPLPPQQKEEYKERFFSSSRVYVDFGDGVKHDTSIIKKKAADEISNWWIKVIEEETSKAYSQGREDGIAKGEVSERKFILTILDGHDQAHKEAGISSHTRTIRMLLSHRHVGKLPDNKSER